ncbi:MAG: hypothetical protein V3W34_18965 [Phycisphaerae bacterium]
MLKQPGSISPVLLGILVVVCLGLGPSERTLAEDPLPPDAWGERGLQLDIPLDGAYRPPPDGPEETVCPPPSPFDLQDITCYLGGQPCAFLPHYTAGTAVARLKFRYRRANGTVWLRRATGFVFDPPAPNAGRTDLLLTNKHVITFPAGSVILAAQAEFFAEYAPNCQCAPPAAAVCPALVAALVPPFVIPVPACLIPLTACSGPKRPIGCWVAPDECDWALIKLGGAAVAGVVPAVLGADPVPPRIRVHRATPERPVQGDCRGRYDGASS